MTSLAAPARRFPGLLSRLSSRLRRPLRPVPVRSSAIEAVRYRRDTEEMQITFSSGATYCYHHVAPAAYRGLMDAPSKGRHFSAEIRGAYPCHRLPA